MKTKSLMTLILCGMASIAMAQSFTVYDKEGKNRGYNSVDVDSIVFSSGPAQAASAEPRAVKGRWCSLGTSISWLNDNTASFPLTKGYQTRVMEKLAFTNFTNKAVNGGVLESAISSVVLADYYTIEHGINDWGKTHMTPVGTIDDYINNTRNGTFAAIYRQLIDRIFLRNKKARVILCTPRKAYGFNGYLPDHWYDPNANGVYLEERVEKGRLEYLGEIEYTRREKEASGDREYDQQRNQDHVEKIIQPGHQDVGVLVAGDLRRVFHPVGPHPLVDTLLTVLAQQFLDRHYKLKDSELEDPPDVELEAHKGKTAQRQGKGHNGDNQRDPGDRPVRLGDIGDVNFISPPLPQAENQQDRREYQGNKTVRNEYYPESDYQES